MKIILLWLLALSIVGNAWLLGVKVSYDWTIEDQERSLAECIQENITCNQIIRTAVDKDKQVEYIETEPIEYPEEAWILEEIVDPEGFTQIEVVEEPVCIDWVGWGESITCIKYDK